MLGVTCDIPAVCNYPNMGPPRVTPIQATGFQFRDKAIAAFRLNSLEPPPLLADAPNLAAQYLPGRLDVHHEVAGPLTTLDTGGRGNREIGNRALWCSREPRGGGPR